MSTQSTTNTLQCGACQQSNVGDAQFCVGCGHSLYEQCEKCGSSVSLTQKFCVACGKDLAEWLQSRLEKEEASLAEAVTAAKEQAYDRSLAILDRASKNKDFRFREIAGRAAEAKGKVESLRNRLQQELEQRLAAAQEAAEREDHLAVVRLLTDVPERFLDDDVRATLRSAKTHLQQLESLQTELQDCLTRKDYAMATGLIGQLLQLQPDNAKYNQLAQQLAEKTVRRVEKLFARQDYQAAHDALLLIPEASKNESHEILRKKIETTSWLSQQFADEPYATNTLGRLAMRFAKDVPADGNAAALVKELAETVKSPRLTPRDAFARWHGRANGWMGGRVGVFAQPQTIDVSALENSPAPFGSFAVAMGLALQGIGQTRVTGNLVEKKGMLSKLGLGKAKKAWGVDVGNSAIRAVLLRLDKGDELPVMEKVVTIELPTPSCRGGNLGGGDTEQLLEPLQQLVEQIDVTNASVWSNLPACQSVGRFCELPPVKDKDASRLIEAEVKQRVPIEPDELALVSWFSHFDKESQVGRPVMMAAATKTVVQRRVDLLGAAGLKLDGLVPEPIALANFAAFEFADVLEPVSETSDDEPDSTEQHSLDEATNEQSDTVGDQQGDLLPTIALVDVGASKTTMLLVSSNSVWYWTQELGGEDVTSVVARATKLTAAEAEQSKRNLAALPNPEEVDEEIAQKLEALRSRMTKMNDEAHRTFKNMDVQATWCVGNGHLQHGFLPRVLL